MIYLCAPFKACNWICVKLRDAECLCCQKPCCGYLMLTLASAGSAALSAVYSLQSETISGNDAKAQVAQIIAGLGLLQVTFAFYLQNRLACKLRELHEGGGDEEEPPQIAPRNGPPPAADQPDEGSPQELLSQMWHISLHDIGFCFQVLVLCASFGYSGMQANGSEIYTTPRSDELILAVWLLVFHGASAMVFTIAWWMVMMCGSCCAVCNRCCLPKPRQRQVEFFYPSDTARSFTSSEHRQVQMTALGNSPRNSQAAMLSPGMNPTGSGPSSSSTPARPASPNPRVAAPQQAAMPAPPPRPSDSSFNSVRSFRSVRSAKTTRVGATATQRSGGGQQEEQGYFQAWWSSVAG